MAADPDCIFCKIVAGEIPAAKIFEDEHVFVFLDIGPLSKGHTLVIPKMHARKLDELPDDVAAACGRVLPRVARAVMQVTGVEDYNVLQNNGTKAHQAVGHVHFHVIPKTDDAGLGIDWPAGQLQDGDSLAAAIAEAL